MESELNRLVDALPGLVWTAGLDGGAEFLSQRWCEFTGISLAKATGFGWHAAIHPDDLATLMKRWRGFLDARQAGAMEARLRRHDGEYRWIVDKGVPRYAANGEFLGYIGSAIDITDRRSQEAALRESEERYREVVESQTDFVCRLLPNLTLTFVNDAYCRFLGRRREQLLGLPLPSLLPESARSLAQDRILSAATGTDPAAWECEVERPDGSNGWQHWVCHRVVNAGRNNGMQCARAHTGAAESRTAT